MNSAIPTLDRIVSGLAMPGPPQPPGSRSCGCRACRRARAQAFEAGFVPTRTDPAVGTPAMLFTLKEWGGWTHGVGLYDLLKVANRLDLILVAARQGLNTPTTAQLNGAWNQATARTTPIPRSFRSYFWRVPAVYRISRIGAREAIDIGMSQTGCPGFRVMAHFMPDYRRSRLALWGGRGRGLGPRIGVTGGYALRAGNVVALPTALRNFQVHLGRFTGSMRRNGRHDVRYVHVFESLLQRAEMPAAFYAEIQGRRETEN